ncbi:MAG: glycosyltransferase family protein [Lutibacter sp.]
MKRVKYIGFYDVESFASEKRVKSIAAVNKMNYIASAMESAGYEVEIVSPSWSANNKGFYGLRELSLSENITLKIGPTFGADNFFTKKLRIFLSWIWLFLYLIRNAEKDEKIVVYHSMMAIYPIYYAQKIKNFKIILELNEIYQDVTVFSSKFKKLEMQIIKDSEAYILSTELLQSKINSKKAFLINYGNYRVSKKADSLLKDKIHIVYAGIIDKYKAGAFNALDAAQFLTEKYIIHIIGFGNEMDIIELERKIKESNKNHECKVIFDGLKTGEQYNEYITKCHLGLSTQSPDAEYNNTSFPSKVLSYLSMGLRVVSVDVESITKSKIGQLLYYYIGNSGKSISEAILKIDINSPYDSKKSLIELDKKFIEDIKNLIN